MFKVLDEICEPKRGTKYSAYVDLYAREDVVIGAGETKIVPLGVKIDMDYLKSLHTTKSYYSKLDIIDFEDFMETHYLEIALRSSLAVKGLIIANGSGKVDLDYPDEIGIILHNPLGSLMFWQNGTDQSKAPYEVKKGDKIAQCTLIKHEGYLMGYESAIIREGGFGSTGK